NQPLFHMAQTPEEKAAAKAAKDREKLVGQLGELGLTPPNENETNEQLAERIKLAKAAAKAAEKAPTGPITVKYRDHEGKPTERTFSPEVHGEKFADLADEFKTTNAS